jgi:alpha-glucosidase
MKGLSNRNLVAPPYRINNAAGSLSNKTIETDLIHANGLAEFDVHNLYGTSNIYILLFNSAHMLISPIVMSSASRTAMLSRRPSLKPMIITRSTFAGAGRHVGHWLGDNVSTWSQYLISIPHMLSFASMFQMPMIGSDVCGFGLDTTETLCARWAMLGAFNPFYRNHNALGQIDQEFYRWPLVAQAAKNAIEIRYKMLDYIYTALHQQTLDGTPLLNPLFFIYPRDPATFSIDTQFFYGSAVLVSPVTKENATDVEIYLPDDIFYDYYTGESVRGDGATKSLTDIAFDTIPLYIRGGNIIPLRMSSANTTTELRKENFNVLVALDSEKAATGSLYLDDGVSLVQEATSDITFEFKQGVFLIDGTFDYDAGVGVETVTVWGLGSKPKKVQAEGKDLKWRWEGGNGTLVVEAGAELDKRFSMQVS